jgi:hypothetical protein
VQTKQAGEMKRVFVDGHRFNGIREMKIAGEPAVFVRGVIECDGQLEAFAAWAWTKARAQQEFNKFLHPNCICRYGVDPKRCPVHAPFYETKAF